MQHTLWWLHSRTPSQPQHPPTPLPPVEFRLWALGCWVLVLVLSVRGSGYRVERLGFEVQFLCLVIRIYGRVLLLGVQCLVFSA